ncbi:hypothetical protein CR513_52647, partial [Mucuna pruriens]
MGLVPAMSPPSWVTLACNLSGGTKVMEQGFDYAWLGWWYITLACPLQVSWFLYWRAQREAGFTEQRTPPAPDSGGITGR